MTYNPVNWTDVKSTFTLEKSAKEMALEANKLLKLIDDNLPLAENLRNRAKACDEAGRAYFELTTALDELWQSKKYDPKSKCAKFFSLVKREKYTNTNFAVQSMFEPVGATMRSPAMMALTPNMLKSLGLKFSSKKFNYKIYMKEVREYRESVEQAISEVKRTIELSKSVELLNKLLPGVRTELAAYNTREELNEKIGEIQDKIDRWQTIIIQLKEKLSKVK